MTSACRIRLTPIRDYQILLFIWRWKVVPTNILKERFFPKCVLRTCFNRLARMRKEGYIESRCINEIPYSVWSLGKRGFNTIKEFLPPESDQGFRSEAHYHDVLSLMLNLGDLISKPECDEWIYSEQELRRVPASLYPEWVPNNFKRRPDGYIVSLIGNCQKAIAIEVELSPKSSGEYESIAMDYAHEYGIVHVVWAVPSLRMARGLHNIFDQYKRNNQEIHSFILSGPLHNLLWHSPIILGAHQGGAIGNILQNHWL